MAKRQDKTDAFKSQLAALHASTPENLRLASLSENRMSGFAAYFILVLPLLDFQGQPVFTDPLMEELFLALDHKFGGCLLPSASSHPPYWGSWHPEQIAKTEKDYVTTIQIFANPIEATNRFFSGLKQILKTAGNVVQEEILIARFDCFLI